MNAQHPPARMRPALAAAIGLALLGSALPGPSGPLAAERERLPGIQGRDDRVMLDSGDWPWSAIGRLNRRGRGFCTGTLIAADAVLTAAHCVFDERTGRRLRPDELIFLSGYRRGAFTAVGRTTAIVVPPSFKAAQRGSLARVAHDWAVLRLGEALATPPVPVTALAPSGAPAPQPALSAGYGQDRPHLLSLHDGCTVTARLAHDRILVHTCDATAGASGSPLLRRTIDGYALIGVITGSADDGQAERGFAVHATAFAEAVRTLRR